MKKIFAFFVATRYWNKDDELRAVYKNLTKAVKDIADSCIMIKDGDTSVLPDIKKEDCLVVVPMSGAVQQAVLEVANHFTFVCFYASYVKGNFLEEDSKKMLMRNAAPTLMDSWAVVKRTHKQCILAVTLQELKQTLKVFEAYSYVTNAKLILIGNTEPWVISNSEDLLTYKRKLGVEVLQIGYQELEEFYKEAKEDEIMPYVHHFANAAHEILEPTKEDIYNASRFAVALLKVIEKYDADGVALACFHLIEALKINSCLGVSFLNDCTEKIAACEGDVDSAVTMLMMKKLSNDKLWMANPNIQNDNTVNFTHCTAPLTVCGEKCKYSLRNHHESGIGVSPQVDFPLNKTITLCRISNDATTMTVQNGISIPGEYEPSCRSQMKVKLNDFRQYLNTALGCHQVMTFENISDELVLLGNMLNINVILNNQKE